MGKTYKVLLNDSSEYSITEEEALQLDSVAAGKSTFHIIKDHSSTQASIIAEDFLNKHYVVKIDNTSYTVKIKDELDQQISEMGFALNTAANIDSITAPMPGLLLDIMVKTGQEVKENDPLLILEAMKMENVIVSPRDGVIKSITIDKGQPVDKNQLLIEFE
ncbi:acetyl-CoA carboxylase biotin carboxyl carrier protein subunit [Aquimarina brevivitae]|uniref:Biotin carboxyl carrier protein n=1 Tax=Aquimarina brevivitae TaxID=323412 RepID=A0A4Q7NYP0_9FLAO|nr:acetyl-CoA carboxylase biotin carboxyl carrier protein subunit [Aquimarina brevivitae]RZS92445.1 biotin carboxyl carrier protein [Aquimarina brevivitae]